MKQASNLLLLLCITLFTQCKITENSCQKIIYSSVKLPNIAVHLLDSTAAAEAIIQDNMEGFFEQIRTLDMEIQMAEILSGNRQTQVQTYKDFLKTEVSYFSKNDIQFVQDAMTKAQELCDNISPDIFPQDIKLIKTKANHYGKFTYYTRENCIIIPQHVLNEDRNPKGFLETILHEIFHIYSRYNLDKREALYRLIGFEKVDNIQVPEALDQRILLNPDGIDYQYIMTLSSDNETTQVIPILYAKFPKLTTKKRGFFAYTQFELFELKKENNILKIKIQPDATSTLPDYFQADFHRQIGPNTGYVIHPDEILADNFALLALSQNDLFDIEQLKPEGRLLLQDIKTILQE